MINLDDRYQSYLHTDKCFTIDGKCERVKGYGWTDDGKSIVGYYVLTETHKLFYNMQEQFIHMEEWSSGLWHRS